VLTVEHVALFEFQMLDAFSLLRSDREGLFLVLLGSFQLSTLVQVSTLLLVQADVLHDQVG